MRKNSFIIITTTATTKSETQTLHITAPVITFCVRTSHPSKIINKTSNKGFVGHRINTANLWRLNLALSASNTTKTRYPTKITISSTRSNHNWILPKEIGEIMKRPKIILACLLRSASALDVNRKPVMDGYISLRQAKRSDVSSISRVNLATLPENYNHQFYVNHIAQWPDLALVAEHVPSEQAVSSGGSIMRKINPFNGHDPNRSSGKVIGYVLGKVEGHATTGISRSAANQKTNGHVTSIAVLSDYRGLRIGSELLAQLHHTMVVNHRSSKCCLNVRMSNRPATRLYSDKMGYEVAKVTKGYYNDGEDAFFMKKQLSEYDVLGDQALLPRVIADFRQQQQIAYGGYQNPPISTSYRQKPGQYGGGQYSEYNSDGYVVPDHNYNDFGEQYEYNDEYGRPLSSSSRSYYKYTSLYDRMSR